MGGKDKEQRYLRECPWVHYNQPRGAIGLQRNEDATKMKKEAIPALSLAHFSTVQKDSLKRSLIAKREVLQND